MNKIKILLVDDHKLMLRGITAILTDDGRFEVVGAATSGEEAINLIASLDPDVVIMDIILKGMTGIEAARWIKERKDGISVILLSMEIKKEYLTLGIQSGISGYLPKDIEDETLMDAIVAVYNGQQFFTEAVTKLVFEDFFRNEKAKSPTRQQLPDGLTQREFEIVRLVAEGKSNKQIAESLFISVKTVETHKSHILEKLGLKNSAEIIKYAVKNKIAIL